MIITIKKVIVKYINRRYEYSLFIFNAIFRDGRRLLKVIIDFDREDLLSKSR